MIQVIGETSTKDGNSKKFVQTFVLAQQPSGYFVLNDILRYIDEEPEEEPNVQPDQPEATGAEVEVPASAEEEKEAEQTEEQPPKDEPSSFDTEIVDKKLEEVSAAPQETASINGDSVAEVAAEDPTATSEDATKATEEVTPNPDTAAQEFAEETARESEKPKDPTPTPVAPRQPSAPAPAPTPAQPAKPMTWASRIAAAAGPPKVSPATPLTTKAAPVPAPVRAAAASAPAAPAQTATSAAQPQETAASTKEAGAEWQTAGSDSKRQNRPQSISGPPAEKEGTLGYVKYVTDKVSRDELEAALAQYGELAYFDINRQKVCVRYVARTIALSLTQDVELCVRGV